MSSGPAAAVRGRGAGMNTKKLLAEGIGTALLVFFAVGMATLTFGVGLTGSSTCGPTS